MKNGKPMDNSNTSTTICAGKPGVDDIDVNERLVRRAHSLERKYQQGRVVPIALVLCVCSALAAWWFAVEQPRRQAEIKKQLELAATQRQEEQKKIADEKERQRQALQALEDQKRQQRIVQAEGERKRQQKLILQERNRQHQGTAR